MKYRETFFLASSHPVFGLMLSHWHLESTIASEVIMYWKCSVLIILDFSDTDW